MKFNKLWYLITLVALAMLPLAGCSGGGGDVSPVKLTEKGAEVTISGQVDNAALKSTAKSVALSPYSTVAASTVYVIDGQDGAVLTSGTIATDGSFKDLKFTLPAVKAILVFKAVTASGTLRAITAIDLSNPPAAGVIVGSQPVVININAASDVIAKAVSTGLGLTGYLGDGGQTLTSKSKTYADALALIVTNGGLLLSYTSSGAFTLVGTTGGSSSTLASARSAKTLTSDDLKDMALDGSVISAFIPGNYPVVNFKVTDKASGVGISGLRSFSLHIAQLQPAKDGTASYWLNYIASGLPQTAMPASSSAASSPSTDAVTTFNTDGTVNQQGYSVIDNGDGTYTATFGANIKANTKVVYDATLVHRIAVGVRSVVVPGVVGKTAGAYLGPLVATTGTAMGAFTNTNGTALVYDFTPSTGTVYSDATTKSAYARDIVTIAACNQCHYRLEYGSNNTSGHLGSRPDTKVCVVCHTPQLAIVATETEGAGAAVGTGNFTMFIHQIHMGKELKATASGLAKDYGANTGGYPQDIRNCTFCHKGADVDKWKSNPSRNACGSCHNNINFATGDNHDSGSGKVGKIMTSDATCVNCHASSDVSNYHLPIIPPNALNAVSVYKGSPYNGVFGTYSAAYQATAITYSGADNNNVPTLYRYAPGTPNSNINASYTLASSTSRLPVGAKAITYVINSVSLNSSRNPVMSFKFQVATAGADGTLGTPVDVVFNNSATSKELMADFVGSPSIYWAWSVPQDGIVAPADFNATASVYLKRVWNGTTGNVVSAATTAALTTAKAAAAATLSSISGGYYTITMTGVTVPTTAIMLTGGIGYTYGLGSVMTKVGVSPATGPTTYSPFATTTQPLTQTNLTAYPYTPVVADVVGIGGLSIPAPNVYKTATGFTGRRQIVDNAKCNLCHARLGVSPTFHVGQRNDAPTCTFCHNVNRVNSGWAVNIKEDVHAIHGAGKRTTKFSWEATAGAKYWNIVYPGVLKNCEQCHVAGFYDFSNSAYSTAAYTSTTITPPTVFDSLLWTTYASGSKAINYATNPQVTKTMVILSGTETVPSTGTAVLSPYVDSTGLTAYGTGFSYNAATSATTRATVDTLVTSPVSSACYACHDTARAKAHMVQNGGTVMSTRSAAFNTLSSASTNAVNKLLPNYTTPVQVEACMVCHGPLSTTNINNTTTPAMKAVHRWW